MIKILQSILVGITMAFVEMGSHKLRSLLSILGVMLGVASLVAMLTLIGGIDVFLNQKMVKWVGSVWFWTKGSPTDDQKLQWTRSPGMKFSDGAFLQENTDFVKTAKEEIDREDTYTCAGIRERSRVRGITADIMAEDTPSLRIGEGRWLSQSDFDNSSRVCVISWEVRDRIRKQSVHHADSSAISSLVGEELTFKNTTFSVVGVYVPADTDFTPWHLRRSVMVPLSTMRTYITGADPNPGAIEVTVSDVKRSVDLSQMIAPVLKSRHRGIEDFEYRTAEWLDNMRSMLSNVGLLMSIVSILSLLVGGLSIMNVMLSSISERIHEIGVRKALGAKTLQIFIQFVAETMTLSVTGGAFGMILGTLPLFFKEAIKKSSDGAIIPTVLPEHVVYVFCVIVGVGIVFGLYPAIKASRMNPVDALRYE